MKKKNNMTYETKTYEKKKNCMEPYPEATIYYNRINWIN